MDPIIDSTLLYTHEDDGSADEKGETRMDQISKLGKQTYYGHGGTIAGAKSYRPRRGVQMDSIESSIISHK